MQREQKFSVKENGFFFFFSVLTERHHGISAHWLLVKADFPTDMSLPELLKCLMRLLLNAHFWKLLYATLQPSSELIKAKQSGQGCRGGGVDQSVLCACMEMS